MRKTFWWQKTAAACQVFPVDVFFFSTRKPVYSLKLSCSERRISALLFSQYFSGSLLKIPSTVGWKHRFSLPCFAFLETRIRNIASDRPDGTFVLSHPPSSSPPCQVQAPQGGETPETRVTVWSKTKWLVLCVWWEYLSVYRKGQSTFFLLWCWYKYLGDHSPPQECYCACVCVCVSVPHESYDVVLWYFNQWGDVFELRVNQRPFVVQLWPHHLHTPSTLTLCASIFPPFCIVVRSFRSISGLRSCCLYFPAGWRGVTGERTEKERGIL